MDSKIENVKCAVCGHNDNSLVVQTRDYRYGRTEIFNMVKCRHCGLIYLNPRPTASSIKQLYEIEYTPDGKVQKITRRGRSWLQNRLGLLWYKLGGNYGPAEIEAKGRLLDIGCGRGDTLESFKGRCADAYGIELNCKLVETCKNKGLNVHCGTVEDSPYPDNYFDVIWMSQVIEHLASPKRTLRKVNNILKPGGRLFIFCPNAASYLSRIFGRYWHGWHIPFHFYAFTEETIKALISESDLIIEKMETSTPPTGL